MKLRSSLKFVMLSMLALRSWRRAARPMRSLTLCCQTPSHAVLQGLDAIGLDNGLCFLCLHFHRLTEHQPCPGCPSRLGLLLEHDQAWDDELAFSHLSSGNLSECIQHFRTLRLLQRGRCRQCIGNPALGESTHSLLLHSLHGLHGCLLLHHLHCLHCLCHGDVKGWQEMHTMVDSEGNAGKT